MVRVLISDVDYGRHHGAARGGVGTQLVGDQSSRNTALGFQQLPKESDGCSPIPVRLHEDVQDVTVLVYCAPQILLATLDRDEHLVEMPGVSHPTAYGATKRPRLVWLLAGRPLMARVASPPRRRCQAAGVPTRSRIGR